VDEKKLSRSRFYVGICAGDSGHSFADLTRRATLVTDTLLLSHDWTGTTNSVGQRASP
jgi:hypothetical protein